MSFRPGALRDAGMVPLSSRETAKGGTQTPQTRFAQTVRYLRPNAVTRELRGTRSPDQGAPRRKLTAVGWWGEKSGGVTAGRKFIAGLCNV